MAALKKYIVTYLPKKVNIRKAADILQKPAEDFHLVEDVLGPDLPEKEKAIQHFEEESFSFLPLSSGEMETLQNHPEVAEVIPDFPIYIQEEVRSEEVLPPDIAAPGQLSLAQFVEASHTGQKLLWNIKRIGADRVWHKATGKGVKVAVLDTGIDDSHPDLMNVKGGKSFVEGVESWNDDSLRGHGTHCAGIIGANNNQIGVVGVAPECELYAVKVLNEYTTGLFSSLLAGLNWAGRQGMDIISISCQLSDEKVIKEKGLSGIRALENTVDRLTEQGCTLIACSGNLKEGEQQEVYQPAKTRGIIAVGATNGKDKLAGFSCWKPGDIVTLCAPGKKICSTYNQGYQHNPTHGYWKKDGTSQACPHVAGAAALLKELNPDWTPAQIRSTLESSASSLNAGGGENARTGYGLLDCYKAIFG